MSYQIVIVQGNLGSEPEARSTQAGKLVVTFRIAVNDGKRDSPDAHVEWFRCVCFEKTAEIARQYLHKGDQVLVQGKLKTRGWKDQQGQDHQVTELVVDWLPLLRQPNGQAPQTGYQQGGYQQGGYPPPQGQPPASGYGAPAGYPPAPAGYPQAQSRPAASYPPPSGPAPAGYQQQPPPAGYQQPAAAPPPTVPAPTQGGWGAPPPPPSGRPDDGDIPF